MKINENLESILQKEDQCVFLNLKYSETLKKQLSELARKHLKDYYLWDSTNGLHLLNEQRRYVGTSRPYVMLQQLQFLINHLKTPSIFILIELSQHLEKSDMKRLFQDNLVLLNSTNHRILLVSSDDQLPMEFQSSMKSYQIEEETKQDIKSKSKPKEQDDVKVLLINALKAEKRKNGNLKIDLIPMEKKKLLDALKNYTENQIKDFVDLAVADGVLNHEDLKKIVNFEDKSSP